MAVNLSDIAAMGGDLAGRWSARLSGADARPTRWRPSTRARVTLAGEHDVAIVGGDTSASPGGLARQRHAPRRRDAKPPLMRSSARAWTTSIAVTGSARPFGRGPRPSSSRASAPAGLDAEPCCRGCPARPSAARAARRRGPVAGATPAGHRDDRSLRTVSPPTSATSPRRAASAARVELARVPGQRDGHARVARALDGRRPLRGRRSGGEDYGLLVTCDGRRLRRVSADGLRGRDRRRAHGDRRS